jgi:hypothetical protein
MAGKSLPILPPTLTAFVDFISPPLAMTEAHDKSPRQELATGDGLTKA